MDVATQFSQMPSSKIIYITPKRNTSQQSLKDTQGLGNIVETMNNLGNGQDPGASGTSGPNISVGLKERPQNSENELEKPINYDGVTQKAYLESTYTGGHTVDISSKPVAATQTVLIPQTGNTILDEMKKRAGEAFRKLNMYQSNTASQELEKKSVLLPGTDSEYRTPGAHYRNKNGQIKRPMNAFMVWAREFRGKLAAAMPNATNSDISIKLGQVWSSLPQEQKRQYYNIAEKIKLKHRQDFPDWVYKPVPTMKKKDYVPAEDFVPVREMATSSIHRNIVPSFPLVNLVPDVNNNQSATTTATRIPVILQPVTFRPGPSVDDRTVKDKLADKICGGAQNVSNVPNVPHFTCGPINPVRNTVTPVQVIEPSQLGQQQKAFRSDEVTRSVSGQKDHTKLGQLLTNPELLNKVSIPTADSVTSSCKPTHGRMRTLQAHSNSVSIAEDKVLVYKQPLTNQEARDISLDHKTSRTDVSKSESTRTHQQKTQPPRIDHSVEGVTLNNSQTLQSVNVTGGRSLLTDDLTDDKLARDQKPVTDHKSITDHRAVTDLKHVTDRKPIAYHKSVTVHTSVTDHKLITDHKPLTDHKPMYLELLDPFDPLMDCDFLYSELYPGCLHLDVARWREYLDISTDDENDPLSRFQDDSDDDIKISPVPLKESLRRLCNANVQRSASGDVITCDIMVPVSNASNKGSEERNATNS